MNNARRRLGTVAVVGRKYKAPRRCKTDEELAKEAEALLRELLFKELWHRNYISGEMSPIEAFLNALDRSIKMTIRNQQAYEQFVAEFIRRYRDGGKKKPVRHTD